MGKIIIVGLGSGEPDLLTRRAENLLRSGTPVYLRTALHPSAQVVQQWKIAYVSFDELYGTCEDFDALNAQIAACLCHAAQSADVIYAVPGQGICADETVSALLQAGVEMEIVPGVDETLARLPLRQATAAIARDGYAT
ncbi:MAG: SAM-dependent methyltransferase, partial [Eubacteriales bacterium]|nr:SAM-dependent methyltransferase [Eubacteriales bacterium]